MTEPTAVLYAPAGVTAINGANGIVYIVSATREVTVPVSMIPTLLAAGFLQSSVEPASITNAMISPTAAIAKSKLAALAIVNADVDAAAAIASSKLADGPTATPTASKIAKYDASANLAAATGVTVGAGKVIGVQAAAIPNASAGTIIDAEARTALNALLAACRTHGLIAT